MASGTNARSGYFGSFGLAKSERKCPEDGVGQRDFSLMRMEEIGDYTAETLRAWSKSLFTKSTPSSAYSAPLR